MIEFKYNSNYHSSIGMAPFEVLYGRRCRTPLCWYDSGESIVLGPEIVQQTTEKVKVSQSRPKSHHNKKRKDLEFEDGDHVFLRVTLVTGVRRALKSKKLTPLFIGLYKITYRIREFVYRVALPPSLSNLYDVFHVSQLQKYAHDHSYVIQMDDVHVRDNQTMEEAPIWIVD